MPPGISKIALEAAINHVFLPAKLPQQQDLESEINIPAIVLSALKSAHDDWSLPKPLIQTAIRTLEAFLKINPKSDGFVDEVQLKAQIRNLGSGDTLAFKVTAQNAAIVISRSQDKLLFECFELSPPNETVMTTKGRLERSVPDKGIAIPREKLNEADFLCMLCATLARMSREEVQDKQEKSRKAGVDHAELRDTPDPGIVSELVFGVLSDHGHSSSSLAVKKRYRDEVLWTNARLPWRRSPAWFLIRVVLQLLAVRTEPVSGRLLYKRLMLLIMSHMLSVAQPMDLSCDTISIMQGKIHHRLLKMRNLCAITYACTIRVLQSSHSRLKHRMKTYQDADTKQSAIDLIALKDLDFAADTIYPFQLLDKHLEGMSQRQDNASVSQFAPTSHLLVINPHKIPDLYIPAGSSHAEAIATLQQFEMWTTLHLDSWFERSPPDNLPGILREAARKYHNYASTYYPELPEATSIMLLTIFTLWTTCDRAAVKICPLLGEYDHGVPDHIFNNLLLRDATHMDQLLHVQTHLNSRRAALPSAELFNVYSSQAFPVRYVNGSPKHQSLLGKIETKGKELFAAKKAELQAKKDEYEKWNNLAASREHETRVKVIDSWCDPPETETIHVSGCQKCKYEAARDAVTIDVVDWPISSREAVAKVIVFELQVPAFYAQFRDFRTFILRDILQGVSAQHKLRASYQLSSDSHLRASYTSPASGNLILMSENKPTAKTHYKNKSILALTPDQVCLPNGLDYRYYDLQGSCFAGSVTFTTQVEAACTYHLPQKALRPFVFRPAVSPDGHSSNKVIASQEACPERMTLEEYKDLASVPLGHRLQWINICAQLNSPSVNLKRVDTVLVMLQCIYQAGPANGHKHRSSHDILLDDTFATLILENVRLAAKRVQANWESAVSFGLFAAITSRVLSLNASHKAACLDLLALLRTITENWVKLLMDKANQAQDDKDRASFAAQAVKIALVCLATTDVEGDHLDTLLTSPDVVATMLQMIIIIQEGVRDGTPDEALSKFLHWRAIRLLHRSFDLICKHSSGVHKAVSATWASYVPSTSGWTKVGDVGSTWITTKTQDDEHIAGRGRTVHLNLLDGQLLVDGLPLDKPPSAYEKHVLYNTLFGRAALKVMPGSVASLPLSAQQTVHGFTIHLGILDGELIVQAHKNGLKLETVPRKFFQHQFPCDFHENFVHWYDVNAQVVIFQPRERPWDIDHALTWTLAKETIGDGWRMSRNGKTLLSLHTSTSKAICRIFERLVKDDKIYTIYDAATEGIQISIPSQRLQYSLQQGTTELISRDHSNMRVDANQSIGCLFGLRSKLVMIHPSGQRIFLVPDATVTYTRATELTSVHIAKDGASTLHAYSIDSLLGRVVDTGTARSKLFLAYLHALTSTPLPDPLTSLTGTEAAFQVMKSNVLKSYDRLLREDALLINKIGDISPRRRFYPAHLRRMQDVEWDDKLSVLSQHNEFETLAQSLIEHYSQNAMFNPANKHKHRPTSMEHMSLAERDNIRCAALGTAHAGAEKPGREHDQVYVSRGSARSNRAEKAALVSAMIHRNLQSRSFSVPAAGSLWQLILDSRERGQPPALALDPSRLSYSATVLLDTEITHFLAPHLLPVLRALATWPEDRKYSITMYLATLSYAVNPRLDLVQLLVLVLQAASVINVLPLPNTQMYYPAESYAAQRSVVDQIIRNNARPLSACPENNMTRQRSQTSRVFQQAQQQAWNNNRQPEFQAFAQHIMTQWPTNDLTAPAAASIATYVDVNAAMRQLTAKFESWFTNLRVWRYLQDLEAAAGRVPGQTLSLTDLSLEAIDLGESYQGHIAERALFALAPLNAAWKVPTLPVIADDQQNGVTTDSKSSIPKPSSALVSLLDNFEARAELTNHEKRYVADLRTSCDALRDRENSPPRTVRTSTELMQDYLHECRTHLDLCLQQLNASVTQDHYISSACELDLGPRLSPLLYLRHLSREYWSCLPLSWRAVLVRYGLAIIAVQRGQRIMNLLTTGTSVQAELANPGHTTWHPLEHPEHLLIEIEGNIVIREVQVAIAQQMQEPVSGTNSVVQLNMGEGKTSVILPMTACSVANKGQLAVCIVGKPQSKQMAQMLRSKIGGLIDRQIYFMPFSRSLRFNIGQAQTVLSMLERCKATGGILLLQPEHLLSFQLMAPEQHLLDAHTVGQRLSEVQDYLDQWSRYIVDECDENFSVKFELVYSIGKQSLIDYGSSRWMLLQYILSLVSKLAPTVASTLPGSMELQHGSQGTFPRTRVLRLEGGHELIKLVADYVCEYGMPSLPLSRQTRSIKEAVLAYITVSKLSQEQIDAVEKSLFWTDTTKSPLMLLRGVLAGGMLLFILVSKRWRVQYGSTVRERPIRLAVPFVAKDVASARSEFSHPDVAILLTCLNYYYEGLDSADMYAALEHLLMSDEPTAEYAHWVKDAPNLPSELQQLEGINLKDRPQCETILFPHLAKSKSAIDYFLSKIVFSKECKEFASKLSASGWDIGKTKSCVTTGFSGTNDSRHLLPLTVKYQTLDETLYTSAQVMSYLLQPINKVHLVPSKQLGTDAGHLLHTIINLEPACEMILDVGAQIIEMTNINFAKAWLRLAPVHKEAVVYVNSQDEICVIDRNGRTELLQSSPFSCRLQATLVLLDEAHTRGIDLKLPLHYRAAVTLGASLTKDRLVQACMRLRQLGHGQSVTFCVHQEIQDKIRTFTKSSLITLQSILQWTMGEANAETRRNMPLWAAQGQQFFKDQQIRESASKGGKTSLTKELSEALLEDEAQTVEQRYRPSTTSSRLLEDLSSSTHPELQAIAAHCKDFDNLDFDLTSLQEEQERELAPEIEQERELQRPPMTDPLPHKLHPLVLKFSTTGVLNQQDSHFADAFVPAFNSLQQTSAAKTFRVTTLSCNSNLWVTKDFASTVQIPPRSFSDGYHRSVAWILVNYNVEGQIRDAVIISPFEANELIDKVRASQSTSLHVFKARVNYAYQSFDELGFYTISGRTGSGMLPRPLAMQLALFSGQLYLSSYADYIELCKFLGLSTGSDDGEVEADGFIVKDTQGRRGGSSGLQQSPVGFLQVLMSTIRRNGDAITKTHLGRILAGEVLYKEDFE